MARISKADPLKWGLPSNAVEVIEKRTPTSKHFRHTDGSFTAIFTGRRLHYLDDDGQLVEIKKGFRVDPISREYVDDRDDFVVNHTSTARASYLYLRL